MNLDRIVKLGGEPVIRWEVSVSLLTGLKLAFVVFALVFAFVFGANLATVASYYVTRAINLEVSGD